MINKDFFSQTVNNLADSLDFSSHSTSAITKSNIAYDGIVTVKLKRGDCQIKRITNHNSGTSLLFKSIASFLCGFSTNTGTQVIPRYLDACNTLGVSQLSYKPPVTGKFVSSYNVSINDGEVIKLENVAIFTAYIPYEAVGDKKIKKIRLMSQVSSDFILAEVDLVEEVFLENSSYSLVIEWAMAVSNA